MRSMLPWTRGASMVRRWSWAGGAIVAGWVPGGASSVTGLGASPAGVDCVLWTPCVRSA